MLVCAVHMMVLHGSCDIHDGPLIPLEVTSHNSHKFSFFFGFSPLQDRSEVFSLEIQKSWIRGDGVYHNTTCTAYLLGVL